MTPPARTTEPIRVAVLGAGNRGSLYAEQVAADPRADVVAVADPDPDRRAGFGARHAIPPERCFADWSELAAWSGGAPGTVDAVLVTTQDALHHAPAMAVIGQGHHVLLEKPIAPTPRHATEIVEAAVDGGRVFAVAHVLRYTPYTRALREILASGVIGDIVTVEHLEPIGWWHFAHSYVRGNWRREDESSPMLLAKCIHDLDWLTYVIDRPPQRVSSFGGLQHFRADQRPTGAGHRCTDCGIEPGCPYSATRLYLSCVGDPERERWPLNTVTRARTTDGVFEALRTSPYGRCVYDCDNDVVDHQVVNIEYAGGVTASFTATAFSDYQFRRTRIFGTHGTVEGDGATLEIVDFRTGERRRADVPGGETSGHNGGDAGLVRAFLDAIASGDPAAHLPDPQVGLDAHLLTWAAEQARREGTVVTLTEFTDSAPRPQEVPAHA